MTKKYLLPIIIILLGLGIAIAIVFHKSKIESHKQEVVPSTQEVVQKLPEKEVQPRKDPYIGNIPEIWKRYIPYIKTMIAGDYGYGDNRDERVNEVIESMNVKSSQLDITGDGIPEILLMTLDRPVGGECYTVITLKNSKPEYINQISQMDHRLVETPIGGCIIGNGINGANFELDAKNNAIVNLVFQEKTEDSKSYCNVTAWTWDPLKELAVTNNSLSLQLTQKTCAEMDDFLNGK